MKKWLLIVPLVIFGAAVIAWTLFQREIGMLLFERAIQQQLLAAAPLDDGLHVFVCGSAGPLPNPDRAAVCLGVLAGDRAFIVDVGDGGGRNLGPMGFPGADLEAILITHLHSDHIDGLGPAILGSWVGGSRDVPLPVYGPIGVSSVVAGFNQVYRIDSGYRTAHHTAEIANPAGYGSTPIPLNVPVGEIVTVLDDGGLKITAARVDHQPVDPALAFRFDYGGRSVTISGDTSYSDGLVALANESDLLMHDALQAEMIGKMQAAFDAAGNAALAHVMHDIPDYHATPEDAARAAQDAGVDALVLYHLVPAIPPFLGAAFLGDAPQAFAGEITLAEDGMIISLPVGSAEILFSNGL